jgi:CO/xanthine dehydrogenase Mo-binding subunit
MRPFWMCGVQVAEVEVGLETGKLEEFRIVAYHDVERAISHKTSWCTCP